MKTNKKISLEEMMDRMIMDQAVQAYKKQHRSIKQIAKLMDVDADKLAIAVKQIRK